jgi:hypothetical protein
VTPQHGVKAFDSLRRRLRRELRSNRPPHGKGGYRALSARYGVSAAMLQKVIVEGYYPRSPEICYKLGIPAYGIGKICKLHGKVCSVQHRPPKPASERKPRPGWGRKPYNKVWPETTLDW